MHANVRTATDRATTERTATPPAIAPLRRDLGRSASASRSPTVGHRIEVVASPLLRRSPHVLYTNVVEPILRWTLVSKSYALVHAACFADGEPRS